MREKYGITLVEPNMCGGFLDCNILETTTFGTGPQTNEVGSDRHADADALQGAVYTGYMKIHGIKTQHTSLPIGIIANVWGPYSARDNDSWYANESGINQHMIDLQPDITDHNNQVDNLQAESLDYYGLYADRIYMNAECIRTAYQTSLNMQLTVAEIEENNARNGCRQSIEWCFCGVASLCHIMHFYTIHWRLLGRGRQSNDIPYRQYRVCVLFYNLYVCAERGNNHLLMKKISINDTIYNV